MRAARPFLASLILTALALTSGLAHRDATRTLVVRHVSVVDVAAATTRDGQAVMMRGDTIVTVGEDDAVARAAPHDALVVDGRRAHVIPGLWDMHVHALWAPVALDTALPLLLAHGVTGIRDMGGSLAVLEEARARIARGDLLAPRLVAAGPILDGPRPVDPSVSIAIGTADEARAAVRRLAAARVDFLKVYTLLPAPAFHAVIEEASRAGLRVSGHVPAEVPAREAALAGMQSIEHMQAELGTYCPVSAPAADCDALVATFLDRGTWQTPTLAVRRARAYLDDPAIADDPRLATVPRALREQWLAGRRRRLEQRGGDAFTVMRREFAHEQALAQRLHARGVPMLAGSDAGADFAYHGSGLHDELTALVEAGLSPAQALGLATTAPAAFLGRRPQAGAIVRGALADLVLLDGNPLMDIKAVRRVRAVVAAGQWLDRPRLDALVDAARAAAR